jgi:serine/threonine protein kinase
VDVLKFNQNRYRVDGRGSVELRESESAEPRKGPAVAKVDTDEEAWEDGDVDALFENLQQVGEGNSGTVFRAKKKGSSDLVALKSVRYPPGSDEAAHKERLSIRNEVLMHKTTRHPNVVEFLGAYRLKSQRKIWVALEYMDGGTLTGLCAMFKLKEPHIACVVREMLKALELLHSMERIHRDIKSDNVLLNSHGDSKLADFGYCAQLTESLTNRTSVVGYEIVFLCPIPSDSPFCGPC